MQRKEALSFLFKVILLGLAILLIIFGLYPKLINGENQQVHFESPANKTMPAEGYFTEILDPLTYVSVKVDASKDVEVHLYVTTYRGGKVISDGNFSLVRDEWLAAGEKGERIGRSVELSDFTAYRARYWVKVVEPEGSDPSDAEYTVDIKAYTVDMTLIIAGLLFYAIFIFLGIFEYLSSINRTLKAGIAMRPEEMAEASDLEALLEPGAAPAAPPTAPAPPAPPTALPSYEAYAREQPPPAPAPPPAAPAPPPEAPMAPEPYAPPAYTPPPAPAPPPEAAAPAPPAYQPPPPPPAAPPPAAPPPAAPAPAAPAPAVPPPAPAPAPAAREPVSKVRCPACKNIVPVYTNERPTPIECPTCGKKGMIR